MKKAASLKLNFIFTAIVLAFSIITFVSMNGSLAWLATNDEANALGMNVNIVGAIDVEATLTVHGVIQINETEGVETDYTFEADKEKFDLPQHDPNNISYDQYMKALVLRFDITAGEGDAELLIDIAAAEPVSTENQNYLSNAVQFTGATVESGSSVAKKADQTVKFVEVTYTGATPTVQKVEQVAAITTPIQIPAGETASVYLIMEYNEDFISYINESMLSNAVVDTEVTYASDVKFIIKSA